MVTKSRGTFLVHTDSRLLMLEYRGNFLRTMPQFLCMCVRSCIPGRCQVLNLRMRETSQTLLIIAFSDCSWDSHSAGA